jgi:hypothetical protein
MVVLVDLSNKVISLLARNDIYAFMLKAIFIVIAIDSYIVSILRDKPCSYVFKDDLAAAYVGRSKITKYS